MLSLNTIIQISGMFLAISNYRSVLSVIIIVINGRLQKIKPVNLNLNPACSLPVATCETLLLVVCYVFKINVVPFFCFSKVKLNDKYTPQKSQHKHTRVCCKVQCSKVLAPVQ